jgi:hypothetical protein
VIIQVVYSEKVNVNKFKTVEVPFKDRKLLQLDDVLFIIMWDNSGIKSRKHLLSRSWGSDYYALIVFDEKIVCPLLQWDEDFEYLRVRPVDNPHDLSLPRVRCGMNFPDGSDITIFSGSYIPPDEWELATLYMEELSDGRS